VKRIAANLLTVANDSLEDFSAWCERVAEEEKENV
jgi:hypothetical protein